MTEENLKKIKQLTNYSFKEIILMSDMEFVRKIAVLQFTSLSTTQYKWLEKQRRDDGLDSQSKLALDVFGGHLTK